jgi:hypothetical protein
MSCEECGDEDWDIYEGGLYCNECLPKLEQQWKRRDMINNEMTNNQLTHMIISIETADKIKNAIENPGPAPTIVELDKEAFDNLYSIVRAAEYDDALEHIYINKTAYVALWYPDDTRMGIVIGKTVYMEKEATK